MSSDYIPAQDFSPIPNVAEHTYAYRWNDRVIDHLFCKTCGVYPYHGDEHYGYRVNLGCVEQIEPFDLPFRVLDGKSMPVAEDPEEWPER